MLGLKFLHNIFIQKLQRKFIENRLEILNPVNLIGLVGLNVFYFEQTLIH